MTQSTSPSVQDLQKLQQVVSRRLAQTILKHDENGIEQASKEISGLLVHLYHKLSEHCETHDLHQVLRDLISEVEHCGAYRGKATF